MIDQIESDLSEWARSVAAGAQVSFRHPAASGEENAIHIHLLEVVDASTGRSPRRDHWEVRLRYLVAAPLDTGAHGRRGFGELLFAALARADFDVELQPPAAAQWTALGTPPRAAFFLCTALRKARPHDVAPLVTEPMKLHAGAAGGLCGVLYGPGGAGLAGARVEIPSLGISARTASDGRFSFGRVPPDLGPSAFRVVVKGREVALESDGSKSKAPVRLHLDSREG